MKATASRLTVNNKGTMFSLCSKQSGAIMVSIMVRSVLEEAVALASLSLFLATVAVWAQVLGML